MARARPAGVESCATAAVALAMLLAGAPARGYDLESAVAYYADDALAARIISVAGGGETRRLFDGEGRATSARLGSTVKRVSFKNPPRLLDEQLEGDHDIVETSATASLDQGLAVGTQVGLIYGVTTSPLATSRYLGVRAGQWWLDETLQTNLDVRRTTVEQRAVAYTDTDGKWVETPADLDGSNAGLTLTHLTTPTTILRGGYSRTERSDRPDAWSASGELRQFVTATSSAVHLALSHYENVGEVRAVSSYGTIVADSIRAEWHQRAASHLILMGGYRYYLESEDPRAEDAARLRLGSDTIYATARWRFDGGNWTGDAPEIYGFAERYKSNLPSRGALVGVGGRYPF